MAAAVELHRCCKAGRTASYNGNAFSGAHFRRLRRNQAGCPCVFDDRAFIFLRADRVSVYVACTGCFAECRADTGGKFRKTVCLGEAAVCLLIVSKIHKVIPLRNEVLQRTAGGHSRNHGSRLAERYTACHTAGSLHLLLLFRELQMKFLKVFDTLKRGNGVSRLALIFHKSSWLTHNSSSSYLRMLS